MSTVENRSLSLPARTDSPIVSVRRDPRYGSLPGLALSRAIAPHPFLSGAAYGGKPAECMRAMYENVRYARVSCEALAHTARLGRRGNQDEDPAVTGMIVMRASPF